MTEKDLQQALEGATDEIAELNKRIAKLQYQVWQGEVNERVVKSMERQREAFKNMIDAAEKRTGVGMVSGEKVIICLRELFEQTEEEIMAMIKIGKQ